MMNNIKKSLKNIVSLTTSAVMACAMLAFPQSSTCAAQIADNELKEMANELSFLVNEFRAENGLHPIYVVPYLCDMAACRARECIAEFKHTRPDGSKFSTIFDANLIPYEVLYENIAAGSDSPKGALEQWKNSEKHRAAMLNPEITHMGVGVGFEQNSEYGWYWEENFAVCKVDLPGQFIPSRYEITPQAEGDLTGDAAINSYDYILLADYLYKKKNNIPVYLNDAQLETADCFRDGILTESDAKVMVRYILGEYTELPFVF